MQRCSGSYVGSPARGLVQDPRMMAEFVVAAVNSTEVAAPACNMPSLTRWATSVCFSDVVTSRL